MHTLHCQRWSIISSSETIATNLTAIRLSSTSVNREIFGIQILVDNLLVSEIKAHENFSTMNLWTNFNHHRGCIVRDIEKLTAKHNKRKENKLSRLISNRKKRTWRCRTKKKTNNNDVKGTVINISNVALSRDEETLLSRGLSFCPRPSRIERFHLIDDIKQFSKRLRLREYFYDSDESNDNDHRIPFRRKSTWTPPPDREPALATYIQQWENELFQNWIRARDIVPVTTSPPWKERHYPP